MIQGYRGISFPFRIGIKGGVVTTTTSTSDISHIKESMQQIVLTRKGERSMEQHIYSDVDTYLFDPNDLSTRSLIAFEVQEALKNIEPRIEVISVTPYEEDNFVYVNVSFKILSYDTIQETNLKVGEINVQSAN